MKKMLCTALACAVGFFAVATPMQAFAAEVTISANDQVRIGTSYTCTECGFSFISLEEHEEGETVECFSCGGTAIEDGQSDAEIQVTPIGTVGPRKE